jgi:apolipoprotein N-acyltransferase
MRDVTTGGPLPATGRVAAVTEPTGWTEYRAAWRTRPWVLLIAILAVVLLVLSVAETFTAGPLAFLFIPGLALLYLHHLLVKRTVPRP